MVHRGAHFVLPALFLGLCLANPVNADIITVDAGGGADATTIQSGINMAGSGDMVSVAPGVYEEYVNLSSGVQLVASGPGVIIDGVSLSNDSLSLVTLSGTSSSTLLEGFEIRNYATAVNGGGVRVVNGGGTIRGNWIHNHLSTGGAGVYLENSTAILDGNTLEGNCGLIGGGLLVDGGDPAIIGNVFDNNTCAGTGGGLYLLDTTAEVIGNTISGNIASNTPWIGGGIYAECPTSGEPLITHNLFTFNNFSSGTGLGSAVYMDSSCSDFGLEYNGFFSNVAGDNTMLDGTSGLDDSLISDTNPKFRLATQIPYVNVTNNDFHLKPASDMIDKGSPFGIDLVELWVGGCCAFLDVVPTHDRDNLLRPQAGPLVNEVQNVRFPFLLNPNREKWNNLPDTINAYNIYRGLLSELSLTSYGSCETELDTATGGTNYDNEFIDFDLPPIGDGFFYVITGENHTGCSFDLGAFEVNAESTLGKAQIGQASIPIFQPERPNLNSCQMSCIEYY